MTTDPSTQLLTRIIGLVDTMIAPFDLVELMDELVRSCLELVPADSAGILLSDMRGGLQILASSTQDMHHLELLELQHEEGPCFESFRLGTLARVEDLSGATTRWPTFAPAALADGVTAVYAIPMTLREHRLGALNLFCTQGRTLDAEHLRIAQVLSSMATIAVLNQRSFREQEILTQQLQAALSSRVHIEQAKGILAERERREMDRAFDLLRRTARSQRRLLSDVAADLVGGQWRIGDPPPTGERVERRARDDRDAASDTGATRASSGRSARDADPRPRRRRYGPRGPGER